MKNVLSINNFCKAMLTLLVMLPGINSYATAWTTVAAGPVTNLASWSNGTTAPTSFANPGDTWTILHTMTLPTTTTWTLGAATGAPAALYLPAGGTLSLGGTSFSGTIVINGNLHINGGSLPFTVTGGSTNITVTGDVNMSAGSFNQSGNSPTQTINIGGNLNMSGGTFGSMATVPRRYINVSGSMNMTGGYIYSSGTSPDFVLNVAGNALIAGDSVKLSKSSLVNVVGDIVVNNCLLSFSSYVARLKSNNNITVNNSTFFMNGGNDTVAAGGNFIATNSKVTLPGYVNIAGHLSASSGPLNLTGGTTHIGGNCTLGTGAHSIYGCTVNVAGDLLFGAGSIAASGVIVNFNVAGSTTVNATTVTGTSTALKIASGGNMDVPSGSFSLTGTGSKLTITTNGYFNTGTATYTLNGSSAQMNVTTQSHFTMSGGSMAASGSGATIKLYINGNCSISGPAAITNSTGTNEIFFSLPAAIGSMMIENTSTGVWSRTNVYVTAGCIAQLSNNFAASLGGPTGHGVIVNGTLICPAAYYIWGTGKFTVGSTGTLLVASPGGINGNVPMTGPKAISAAARYVYNGSAAQVTGTDLPANLLASSNVNINNAAGVTLSQNTSTAGTITLSNGILHTGSYTLTTTSASAIAGADATKYIDGYLRKNPSGLSTMTFEVGNTSYTPVTLALSASMPGQITVKSTAGAHYALGTSGIMTSNMADHFWSIFLSVPGSSVIITPTFSYNSSTISGGSNASFSTQRYSGGTWLGTPLTTTNTSSPSTSTSSGISADTYFSGDYVVGNTCGVPITGTTLICAVGGSTTLSNSIAGGVWSSSNPAVATVSATGHVSGVGIGTAVINYVTIPACTVSAIVNVGVPAISGPSSICPSGTATMTTTAAGGTWASSTPSVAAISPLGVVSAGVGGTATISYTMGACSPATHILTVAAVAPITGTTTIISGNSTTLSCATPGGLWSSSNPFVASITPGGVVTGLTAGSTSITYQVGSCWAVQTVTVVYDYTIIADSVRVVDTACSTPYFYVKVNGFAPLLRVKTWYGDGYKDSVSLTTSGSTSYKMQPHAYACAGTYTVRHVVYYNNIPTDTLQFSYQHKGCKNIRLRFYFDADNDCVKDAGEVYNAGSLLVKVDSAGVPIDTLSAIAGLNYKVYGPAGTVYSFTTLPTAGFFGSCPVTETITPGVTVYPIRYFGIYCTGASEFDLQVNAAIPVTAANLMQGNLYIRNNFCTPTNATVTLHYSPLYTHTVSVSPVPVSATAGTLTWNLAALSVGSGTRTISFKMKAISGGYLPVGSVITEKGIVTPIIFDNDTCNNHDEDVDTVTGPHDPNMVEVMPKGCFTEADTMFRYTIHFENMGNDTAHNIYVMDTLSEYIDLNKLRVIVSSADMDVTTYKDGPYSIARFDFPDIKLLDSSHHGLCDGAVIFTVPVKPGLANGTVITNHAGIYFDYQDAVLTNTTYNAKGCPDPTIVVTKQHTDDVRLFPNPTTGELTIEANYDMQYLTVTNMVGQTVYTHTCNGKTTNINVANLSPGIYMLRTNGAQVVRFVKQ